MKNQGKKSRGHVILKNTKKTNLQGKGHRQLKIAEKAKKVKKKDENLQERGHAPLKIAKKVKKSLKNLIRKKVENIVKLAVFLKKVETKRRKAIKRKGQTQVPAAAEKREKSQKRQINFWSREMSLDEN